MSEETSYGVTSDGYIIKPYDVMVEQQLRRQKKSFGEDIYQGPASVMRKFVEVPSTEMHNMWKLLAQVYYSGSVVTAQGNALDLLAANYGLQRKLSEKSVGRLAFQIVGTDRVTVPSATICETLDGTQFETDIDLEISFGKIGDLALITGMSSGSGLGTVNYLPQPYDRNTDLAIVFASNSYAVSDTEGYIESGSTYIYSDTSNVKYSYGLRNNLTFYGYNGINITQAYIIWSDPARNMDGFYVFDDSTSTFTETTDFSSPVALFNNPHQLNDYFLVGSGRRFSWLEFDIDTAGTNGSTLEMKIYYWSSQLQEWKEVSSFYDPDKTTLTFDGTGTNHIYVNFTEDEWKDWGTTTETGGEVTSLYYLKFQTTIVYVTEPTINSVTVLNGEVPNANNAYSMGVIGNVWGDVETTAIVAGTESNATTDNVKVLGSEVTNVASVINQSDFQGGRDIEGDPSFQVRIVNYRNTFYTKTNTEGRLQGVTGVDAVYINDGKLQDTHRWLDTDIDIAINSIHAGTWSGTDFTSTGALTPVAGDYTLSVGGNTTKYYCIYTTRQVPAIYFDTTTAYTLTASPGGANVTISIQYGLTNVTWSTAFTVAGGTLIDETNVSGDYELTMQQDGWVMLAPADGDLTSWIADSDDGYYKILIGITTTDATVDNWVGSFRLCDNRSPLSAKAARTSASVRQGISRAQHHDISEGEYYNIPNELTDSSPILLVDSTKFWCDFQDSSTIWVYPGLIEGGDELTTYYADETAGIASVEVVVLPTISPLPSDVYSEVYNIVKETAPWVTRYTITEALPVTVNVTGNLSYDTANYTINEINASVRDSLFDYYFNDLGLGETVYRNKIIGIVMATPGVVDIESLVFSLEGEKHEGQGSGSGNDEVNLAWANIDIAYKDNVSLNYDDASDGTYEATWTIASGGLDSGTFLTADVSAPHGQFKVVLTLNATSTWTINYKSSDGNIYPRVSEIGKLGTVTFT